MNDIELYNKLQSAYDVIKDSDRMELHLTKEEIALLKTSLRAYTSVVDILVKVLIKNNVIKHMTILKNFMILK